MAVNCICSAAFCESAALREKPAQAFSGLNPLSFAALSSSPEGGAFRYLAVSRAKPPPFGGGGIAVGDDGEGSS